MPLMAHHQPQMDIPEWANSMALEDLMVDDETMATIMSIPIPPAVPDNFGMSGIVQTFDSPPPPYSESAVPNPVPMPVPAPMDPTAAAAYAPAPTIPAPSVSTTTLPSRMSSTAKPRASGGGGGGGSKKWASEEDWETHRATITRLWIDENKKLWQLVDYMEREHQFFATPKMYKTRFRKWHLWKNTKAADVAEVFRQTGTEIDIPGGAVAAPPGETTTTRTTTKTTTTTTVTTTTTTTTTKTVTTSSPPSSNTPTTDPSSNSNEGSGAGAVFLVNGKQVDIKRIERYIRNRCRQHRVRPGDLSATLMNLTSAAAGTTNPSSSSLITKTATGTGTPKPLGLSLTGGKATLLLSQESALRIVSSYFDGSLSSGRWTFASDAVCDLDTPGGCEMARISSEFHERFKIAAPMLAEGGTKNGAEAVKMVRICFAELPKILSGGSAASASNSSHNTPGSELTKATGASSGGGGLGPEDPHLLVVFLVVLQAIRKQGESLRWMEVQLAKYMADLAASLPGGRPTSLVWKAIRDAVLNRTLDDRFSFAMCQATVDICRKYLGPLHAKTMELEIAGVCNFDFEGTKEEVITRQEGVFREMVDGLDSLGTVSFDERHAGIRMNLTTFYNFHEMWDKAERFALETVSNPWMMEGSKRYRGLVFKYYYDLGKARYMQKKYELAVQSYKDAIEEAKREMKENMGGEANVIEGLTWLETCLRDMGRTEEAEEAVKEREGWVKEGLKGAGEPETVNVDPTGAVVEDGEEGDD